MTTRRCFVAGGLAATLMPAAARNPEIGLLRIRDDQPAHLINPLIFGSNEIGVMDKGPTSASLDARAGVMARRLGGDLMTGYNWVNNATNAGKNYRHSNGAFLLEALEVAEERWSHPAAVIETMHDMSLELGAKSLVTLPLAGHVAADMAGAVSPREAAPSRRFVPVVWQSNKQADDAIDSAVADIPHLLARLVKTYGSAADARGIHAYALDNEPGIWFQNHPRLTPERVGIADFIERSIAAARVVKTIDPAAQVFGPASWGATEMVSFQDAPDWPGFRDKGSFLAAYLDAFRQASEREGRRLLDVLDVHWYPFHRSGGLFRTEDPALDEALLAAPRSLSEPGFREDSWVSRALRDNQSLALPILPSLRRLVENWFPGTGIAVTEFNYGGAGRLAAGLALADALGRFAEQDIAFATHWGSLDGWLNEAYRLFRLPDAAGGRFEGRFIRIEGESGPDIAGYGAVTPDALQLVLINKSAEERIIEIDFAGGRARTPAGALGFDAELGGTMPLEPPEMAEGEHCRLTLPARSARRYAFR